MTDKPNYWTPSPEAVKRSQLIRMIMSAGFDVHVAHKFLVVAEQACHLDAAAGGTVTLEIMVHRLLAVIKSNIDRQAKALQDKLNGLMEALKPLCPLGKDPCHLHNPMCHISPGLMVVEYGGRQMDMCGECVTETGVKVLGQAR